MQVILINFHQHLLSLRILPLPLAKENNARPFPEIDWDFDLVISPLYHADAISQIKQIQIGAVH